MEHEKDFNSSVRDDTFLRRHVRGAKARALLLLQRALRIFAVLVGGASFALLYAVIFAGSVPVAHATIATSSQETLQITNTAEYFLSGTFLSTSDRFLVGMQLFLRNVYSNPYTNDVHGHLQLFDSADQLLATSGDGVLLNDANVGKYVDFWYASAIHLYPGHTYKYRYYQDTFPGGFTVAMIGNGLPWFNGELTCSDRYQTTTTLPCTTSKMIGPYLLLWIGYDEATIAADSSIQRHPVDYRDTWSVTNTVSSSASGTFDMNVYVSLNADMSSSTLAAHAAQVWTGTQTLNNTYIFQPFTTYYARTGIYFNNIQTGAYTLAANSPTISWGSGPIRTPSSTTDIATTSLEIFPVLNCSGADVFASSAISALKCNILSGLYDLGNSLYGAAVTTALKVSDFLSRDIFPISVFRRIHDDFSTISCTQNAGDIVIPSLVQGQSFTIVSSGTIAAAASSTDLSSNFRGFMDNVIYVLLGISIFVIGILVVSLLTDHAH